MPGIMPNQTQRSNYEWNVAALAAAAVAGNSSDFENLFGYAAHIFVNVTAITGTTPVFTVFIEEKDPVSGLYYALNGAAGTALVVGLNRFVLALSTVPASPPAGTVWINDFMPKMWRVRWTITGTTPAVTATISASVCSQQGT